MAAKKATGKKAPSKKAKMAKSEGIDVKVNPSFETPQTRVYSNFMQITQTPYDFSIKFCDATPLKDKSSSGKTITHNIPVVVEVAVPFNVVPGLIRALQTQWDEYLGVTGIKENGKKQAKE